MAELLWGRLHCLRQCLEYATLLNSDLCSYNYPYDKAETHYEQVRLWRGSGHKYTRQIPGPTYHPSTKTTPDLTLKQSANKYETSHLDF